MNRPGLASVLVDRDVEARGADRADDRPAQLEERDHLRIADAQRERVRPEPEVLLPEVQEAEVGVVRGRRVRERADGLVACGGVQ